MCSRQKGLGLAGESAERGHLRSLQRRCSGTGPGRGAKRRDNDSQPIPPGQRLNVVSYQETVESGRLTVSAAIRGRI